MRCCSLSRTRRNGEEARKRMERVSSPTPSRTRATKSSVLFISFFLSSSLVASVVPAYKYCISRKERNKRTNRRMVEEKEQGGCGGGGVKRNCFWQSTTATDDDADAARHEYEDASRRFVRRDVAI